MSRALLIDADMAVEDAVAVCLAISSGRFEVRAVVAVGGSVSLDQAVTNSSRLIAAFAPTRPPTIARGLPPAGASGLDRREVVGEDGFCGCEMLGPATTATTDFREAYEAAAASSVDGLTIVALGPLTNVAAVLDAQPHLASSIRQILVCGGAIRTKGNVGGKAEFNLHKDPTAAARVLSSGLPITVAALDVTAHVAIDESHAARLIAGGSRAGETAGRLLSAALAMGRQAGRSRFALHEPTALASLLWPELFLRSRVRLEVVTEGDDAGRLKPLLGGDKTRQIELLTAVNAADVLENMLEMLNHEAFVV